MSLRPWEVYLTPSLTLSLILLAEQPPSFARWAGEWALWLRQPALLRTALQYEIEARGGALPEDDSDGDAGAVVSAGTLRVVDYAYFREVEGKGGNLYQPLLPDALSMSIANAELIDVPSVEHDLLQLSLGRVLQTYTLVDRLISLAETPFPKPNDAAHPEAEVLLKELWSRLRPEREFPGLVGKHWQEIGFQNTSPSTDFRGVGMLGLHALLHFARTYGERAAEIVDESVGAGEQWYPLALASLHMTAFCLDLAKTRDLQLFLLRFMQTPSASLPVSASTTTSASLIDLSQPDSLDKASPATPANAESNGRGQREEVDIEPFLRISSDLLLLFHAHWRQGDFTVMQFEQVSRAFQNALRPWMSRGVLDGRALGWEKWDEGGVKLE
ncbi:hypothetical protein JCM10213_004201 [Rhodosporidiobolus nylandii]